jgi:hypothetical protein
VEGGLSVGGDGNVETHGNTVLRGEMPEEARVILLPNKYDEKRANLAVFNWRKQAVVNVPTNGFLKSGDRIRLLDPLDFYGRPVFEGKCDDGGLAASVSDEFAALVVLKD